MIYKIYRSSNGIQPTANSFRHKFQNWETRTCTEEVFNERFSNSEGLWRSVGTNHTVTNGGTWIMRQREGKEDWAVDISSLDELNNIILELDCRVIVQWEGECKCFMIDGSEESYW